MEDKENHPDEVKDHGAITKIVFHNFLTYDDATCVPGPFLNVIIGPNGTGKSTILCGICFAAGGAPGLLGRSDDFSDYIKHGKEDAFVELHLLENIQSTLKSLRAIVKNFQEREKRAVRISLLRQQRVLKGYEASQAQLAEDLKQRDVAKKAYNNAQKQTAPVDEKIANATKMRDQLVKKATITKKTQETNASKLAALTKTLSLEDELSDNTEKFNHVKEQFNQWDEQKAKIAADRDKVKELLESAELENQPNPDIEKRAQELKSRTKDIHMRDNQLRSNMDDLNRRKGDIERAKRYHKQSYEMKIRDLARVSRNDDNIAAWDFYERNQGKFRFPVFVPFLHMYVPTAEGIRCLNNTVGVRDVASFIFGCNEDEDLLLNAIKPLKVLILMILLIYNDATKVNTTVVTKDMIDEFRDSNTIMPQEFLRMGFTKMVSEMYEAPLPVKAHICSSSYVDRIPIGGQEIDDNTEGAAQNFRPPYSVFLTNKSRVQVKISRYDHYVSTARNALRDTGPFSSEIHSKQPVNFEEEERKLQNDATNTDQQREQLEADKEVLSKEWEEIKKQQETMIKNEHRVIELKAKFDRFEQRCQNFAKQKPDIDAARNAFELRKKILAEEAIGEIMKLSAELDSYRISVCEGLLANEEVACLNRTIRNLTDEKEALLDSSEKLKKEYQEKSNKYNQRLKEIQEDKERLVGMIKAPGKSFTSADAAIEALKKKLVEHNIPDNLEQIEAQIVEERERLDIGQDTGTQEKETWKDVMDQKLTAWLAPLQDLILRVSANYSKFFEHLGCEGQVKLDVPADKYNIEEYGVTILVKFRASSALQPLNHQVQSGGERSVATMLFIIALHSILHVPFLCVDEINQGMDPINERKIFNMMVSLSDSGKLTNSQYFIFTPKLLNGLHFNDHVAVHIVHNGPTMENAQYWDPEKFLRAA
ncbi:AAA domain-containing protein [Ditylenchus destructor]|uniref:Structural maintenance of chromosomes protein 5 n=1 Tax=Ditylenchus destructor TaxID=166010 RepID=A0AAD4RDC4_9BILA|nr:AAA domain-containing protein [Ditylenchus destructor]